MRISQTYEEWRASVPWTDEQIATAIDATAASMGNQFMRNKVQRWADHLRKTGRLHRVMMHYAIGLLVTTCGLCDRKALYRFGSVGRCSKHRDMKPDWWETHQREYDQQVLASFDKRRNEKDRSLRDAHRLHQMSRAMKYPSKP